MMLMSLKFDHLLSIADQYVEAFVPVVDLAAAETGVIPFVGFVAVLVVTVTVVEAGETLASS